MHCGASTERRDRQPVAHWISKHGRSVLAPPGAAGRPVGRLQPHPCRPVCCPAGSRRRCCGCRPTPPRGRGHSWGRSCRRARPRLRCCRGGKGDEASGSVSDGAGPDQFAALLGPDTGAAGVDPAGTPCVPVALHLAPHAAHRVLANLYTKYAATGTPHAARVGAGKIRTGDQRVGSPGAALIISQGVPIMCTNVGAST
jgi:hypothetical protein